MTTNFGRSYSPDMDKRSFFLGLSFSVLFVAGCMVGAAARPLVVPAARANSPVERWDYFCVEGKAHIPEEIEQSAKQAGREGWEMVAIASSGHSVVSTCFKRPL